MQPDAPRIYATLQEWMEATGNNKRSLAKLANIKESFLSKILTRSRRCSLVNAMRLHNATGGTVPVENLVRWFQSDTQSCSERLVKRQPRKHA